MPFGASLMKKQTKQKKTKKEKGEKNKQANKTKQKAHIKLGVKTDLNRSYLQNTNEKKRHQARKSHMNHCKCYWIRKIEVLWRKDPLQK